MQVGSSDGNGSGRSMEDAAAGVALAEIAGEAEAGLQETGKDDSCKQQQQQQQQQQQREVSPCSDGGSGLSGGLGTQLGELSEHLTADMVKDGLLPAAAAAGLSARSGGSLIKAGKRLQEKAVGATAVEAAAAAADDDAAAAAAGVGEDGGDLNAALDTAALFAFAGGESD
jgi:hypothetical protein